VNTEITEYNSTTAGGRFGDGAALAAANSAFTCLPGIYAWVALKGVKR
jgi:hypothetical protein